MARNKSENEPKLAFVRRWHNDHDDFELWKVGDHHAVATRSYMRTTATWATPHGVTHEGAMHLPGWPSCEEAIKTFVRTGGRAETEVEPYNMIDRLQTRTELERKLKELADILRPLDGYRRVDVIEKLLEVFCEDCGAARQIGWRGDLTPNCPSQCDQGLDP